MKMRVILSRSEFDIVRSKIGVAAQLMHQGQVIAAYEEIVGVRHILGRIAWQLEPKQKKVKRR